MFKKSVFIGVALFVLSLITYQSTHAILGFGNNASALQRRTHFVEGGLDDTIIYVSGEDTITTDTITCAGFSMYYQEAIVTQAGDSADIVCSLYTCGKDGWYTVAADVNNLKNYAQVLDIDTTGHFGRRVAYPNRFRMYMKLFSTANTGDSAEVVLPVTLDP